MPSLLSSMYWCSSSRGYSGTPSRGTARARSAGASPLALRSATRRSVRRTSARPSSAPAAAGSACSGLAPGALRRLAPTSCSRGSRLRRQGRRSGRRLVASGRAALGLPRSPSRRRGRPRRGRRTFQLCQCGLRPTSALRGAAVGVASGVGFAACAEFVFAPQSPSVARDSRGSGLGELPCSRRRRREPVYRGAILGQCRDKTRQLTPP